MSFFVVFISQMRTTSPAAFTRVTVVTAIKYALVERPEKIDEILYPEISSFLMLIKDDDRVIVFPFLFKLRCSII